MQFEYDNDKNISNLKKHGISLEEAEKLWDHEYVIVPAKKIKEEQRYFIISKYNNKIYTCVFLYRESIIRLISCHRADKKLQKYYYEKVK
ncbi:MAG: BrnT family toxin [Cytophagales bacterium]|nr:BrnT family toxin [Cytophagales bacterium]